VQPGKFAQGEASCVPLYAAIIALTQQGVEGFADLEKARAQALAAGKTYVTEEASFASRGRSINYSGSLSVDKASGSCDLGSCKQ